MVPVRQPKVALQLPTWSGLSIGVYRQLPSSTGGQGHYRGLSGWSPRQGIAVWHYPRGRHSPQSSRRILYWQGSTTTLTPLHRWLRNKALAV